MSKRGTGGKKKNSGCGCLLLFIIAFAVYAAGQPDKKSTTALPTVARQDTATPRPTRVAQATVVPTVTHVPTEAQAAQLVSVAPSRTPLVVNRTAQLATTYPEGALKAALRRATGVTEVTTAMVTQGPSVYAEVQVKDGQADERMANRLRLALAIEEIEAYKFILDDGRQVVDYTYQGGSWSVTRLSIRTPLPDPNATPLPPIPTRTATRQPTAIPANNAEVLTVPDRDYWATNGINVRACPSTSCNAIGRVNQGTRLTVNGWAEGEAVNSGNKVWYRVQYGGGYGFVYSGVVTDRAPVVAPTAAPQVQQSVPSQPQPQQPANTTRRPKNCDEARAMGLSPQQAAQWPHLDRDKDGVACYGD